MSSVYATEPTTTGRVVFETTHGPLDISLWCRECPSTTKLFLQLCIDGYYDNMLFHRIVPSLLIQTGATRSTTLNASHHIGLTDDAYRKAVQADEALDRRPYELNPRLRFNHRGQVAMALGLSDDDNGELQPQFFITTSDAPYLDGKHILFGTLGSSSPTIFNAIRIGDTAVDETTNQPLELEHAPRVLSTRIVENMIHTDLVPQEKIPWRLTQAAAEKKKKKKRKGKLDVNVLSFGDEMGDIAMDEPPKKSRKPVPEAEEQEQTSSTVAGRPATEKPTIEKVLPANDVPGDREPYDVHGSEKPSAASDTTKVHSASSRPTQGKESKLSMVELRRSKYTMKKKSKQEREDQTLAKLMAFQQKLGEASAPRKSANDHDVDNSLASRMARHEDEKRRSTEKTQVDSAVSYHGQVLDSDGEENASDWMDAKFKCRRHMDHFAGADGRNVDEYDVIDGKKSKGESRSKHRKKHTRREER